MSSSGEAVFRAVETPLFCLGALTAAWLSVCSVCRLLSGIKVWVLGNGRLVSPAKLGKWAGEEPQVSYANYMPDNHAICNKHMVVMESKQQVCS